MKKRTNMFLILSIICLFGIKTTKIMAMRTIREKPITSREGLFEFQAKRWRRAILRKINKEIIKLNYEINNIETEKNSFLAKLRNEAYIKTTDIFHDEALIKEHMENIFNNLIENQINKNKIDSFNRKLTFLNKNKEELTIDKNNLEERNYLIQTYEDFSKTIRHMIYDEIKKIDDLYFIVNVLKGCRIPMVVIEHLKKQLRNMGEVDRKGNISEKGLQFVRDFLY